MRRLLESVEQVWEGGQPAAPMRALAGGYLGLLQARDWLYRRGAFRSRRLPCPVISIGNLTVGGSGKTPAVVHAVETLGELGVHPAVVSRGYGRRTSGVNVVGDGRGIRLDPAAAGDEPFLLASRLPGVPVVVGEDRHAAGHLAVARLGATAVVLDDGFQHRSLAKDVEVVLAGVQRPWGNGRLVPAGPLREPLTALARADLIVATGAGEDDGVDEIEDAARRFAPGVPLARAVVEPEACWEVHRDTRGPASALRGKRLHAFAGIARPARFRRTLAALGVEVAGFDTFPDHFWYGPADLARLAGRSGAEGLVTTEKDWVRLRDVPLPDLPLYIVTIRFRIVSGRDAWREILRRRLR